MSCTAGHSYLESLSLPSSLCRQMLQTGLAYMQREGEFECAGSKWQDVVIRTLLLGSFLPWRQPKSRASTVAAASQVTTSHIDNLRVSFIVESKLHRQAVKSRALAPSIHSIADGIRSATLLRHWWHSLYFLPMHAGGTLSSTASISSARLCGALRLCLSFRLQLPCRSQSPAPDH